MATRPIYWGRKRHIYFSREERNSGEKIKYLCIDDLRGTAHNTSSLWLKSILSFQLLEIYPRQGILLPKTT